MKPVLGRDYVKKCTEGLFAPITPGTVQSFLLMKNGKVDKIVEVSSLVELLLATVPKEDREIFATYRDQDCRSHFLESLSHPKDQIIPVRISPASYSLMVILDLIKPEKEDLSLLLGRVVKKFNLSVEQQRVLEGYAKTSQVLEGLLKKKRAEVMDFLSTELEDLQDDLVSQPKPWLEVYESFARVWGEEKDPVKRKQVYRDLGYTKNPKKTPELNKKVLASKFKEAYEGLEDASQIELGNYLESSTAKLARAKKILLG